MSDLELAVKAALIALQAYTEAHPRPSHVTQAQAAEMLGVHPATVSRMVRAGTLRLNKCGLLPISEIDRALVADRAA